MNEENKIEIPVPEKQCESCAMALRRFIGRVKGVNSIRVEDGKVTITFDKEKISESKLFEISKESLEKLGHSF